MRVFSLGSGSSGNAFLVETPEAAFMIDCGVGVRVIRRALQDLDLAGRLSAIFLSHEHIDHVRALASIMRTEHCPVYATAGTFAAIGRPVRGVEAVRGSTTTLGGARVTLVPVPHDGADPCGFVVEADGRTLAIFTDLGMPTTQVSDALQAADFIVLESNYEEALLRKSSYPSYLKARIRGPSGHLSNDDCAGLLDGALSRRAQSVWLAHLSENNNDPLVAEAVARSALQASGRSMPIMALPRFDWMELDLEGSIPVYQEQLAL
jgi:phosphoribosyl 1,2-cyclic phosphodiesterase